MNHPYLAVGQEVTYIGGDGKSHKAKITQIYNEDEVAVSFEGGSAVCAYSDQKDSNTFHFEQASPKAEHKK
jgi:hypothetical protein